jgi:hypothetical protein
MLLSLPGFLQLVVRPKGSTSSRSGSYSLAHRQACGQGTRPCGPTEASTQAGGSRRVADLCERVSAQIPGIIVVLSQQGLDDGDLSGFGAMSAERSGLCVKTSFFLRAIRTNICALNIEGPLSRVHAVKLPFRFRPLSCPYGAVRRTKKVSESALSRHGSGRAKLTPLGECGGSSFLECWPG